MRKGRNRLTQFSASYCWYPVSCCCLPHPLVPWGWEELKLRSLWRLVLVGSRSFLCLVNSYALGCKVTARARLGLWALDSESRHAPCKKSEPKSKKMMKFPLWPKCYYFTKDNQVPWHKELIWLCLCNRLYLQVTVILTSVLRGGCWLPLVCAWHFISMSIFTIHYSLIPNKGSEVLVVGVVTLHDSHWIMKHD